MAAPVLLPPPTHASEAQHWYSRTGEPAYEVLAKGTGLPRPTTLRDARQLELVPSVTTIIKCAASPGLELWKQEQMLLAALTLPRTDAEAERDWLARIKQDSQEQGRAAAERGTEIHAAIERYYATTESGSYLVPRPHSEMLLAVDEAVHLRYGYLAWNPEYTFAHPLGFGGKADLLSGIDPVDFGGELDVLLDFKTKDPWKDTKGLAFDENAMQLAAYRVGLGRPEATCANVFVSRQEPWQVAIHEWTEADLERGWAMFQALLAYHKAATKYDGSWEASSDGVPY